MKSIKKSTQTYMYFKGAFVWEYSGIRIYSGIYSGYSATGSRIARMEIQVFQNRKSSQTMRGYPCHNCFFHFKVAFFFLL